MEISVQKDDLSDGSIINLLELHLQEMHKHSPPGSVHALDREGLVDPAVSFWSAKINGILAGCGALKEITPTLGEIKSMKTDFIFLRKGVARALLERIITEAKLRQYQQIKLETGSSDPFAPAVALYRQYGFQSCGPFSNYKEDPYSLFFCKQL
ncbi:GNAT family N-acetyltransferase [Microbulbifer sp. OS29]|uniref:GNAT family N-acetyltransferase n=1 Tax=Microbulbifer okhotskensis TaxID=2926617 RepID=A0A9X2J5P6_9GAMM|nr:GNAT family N-acetyltransferase [Microbulbifer okhotskensis]MCO1335772.1 GNAT family N-acetyltransferase [Microbulbifer okhotskensis]